MRIRVYFEGNKFLKTGFDRFFSGLNAVARQKRSSIETFAAKDGISAYRKALKTDRDAWNILLKDSEGPVPSDLRALCERFGIPLAQTNDVFWMVEVMESWFLAHPEVVEAYYSLPSNTLRRTQDVERLAKAEVKRRLSEATRRTSKGEYHKVKHAPYLLEKLEAQRVRERAPHCGKLFESIEAKL